MRTFAWMVLLQRRGPINQLLMSPVVIEQPLDLSNNIQAMVIGMTHVMLPFMILPMLASMRAVDRG